MKALIFAAGLGTRLRPLTDNRPKALVEVAGRPMLEHVIRHLISYGFTDIVVNIHHFGQQIVDFLRDNGNFGVNIQVSDERGELLDTGETRPEGFVPSASQLQLAFGGVHVISPTVFDALAGYTDAHKFSITPFYVDMCRRLKIMGYIPDTAYRWFDIGSPEKLAQAEAAITGSQQ